MDRECKGRCLNAKWIAGDLNMLDAAIAEAKASTPH
jgi:hypothetical protein